MKNKIVFICVFIFSLFFIDGVNAETFSYDYNNSNLDLLKNNLSIVDSIKDLSNEFNTNNYIYYVSYYKQSGSYYLSVGVGTYKCSSSFYTFLYTFDNSRYLYNGNVSYLNGTNNFCEDFEQIGSKIYSDYVSLNLSNLTDESLQTFLTSVKSLFVNGSSRYGSLQEQTYQNKSNLDVFSNNNFSVPVYSNYDLKFVKTYNDTSTNEKIIKIGDNLYNYNDIIPTYYDYFELDKPKKYKFDDIIHDDNIAQTYFNLDLEQLKSNDYNLELNYAVSNYTDNVLSPYLKITYVDNTYAILSQSFNENPIVHVFMGEFNSCLAPDKEVKNVQLVFPMETTNDIDYKIQLTSNVNFDLSYVYDEEFNQSLTKIDLTGKYSLILIPKVTLQNEVFQDFYLNGDLEVRGITDIDNITSAQVGNNKIYNGTFRYLTDFRYTVHAIQFVNNDYEEYPNLEKSVTFDANFFDYYIVDTKNDTITIINPNTDKKSDLNMSDINYQHELTNSDKDSKTVFGMFKSINNYISTLKDTFKIFIEQFNFLFTNLNAQVQLAIKTIFIVVVVCSIVIMIRK